MERRNDAPIVHSSLGVSAVELHELLLAQLQEGIVVLLYVGGGEVCGGCYGVMVVCVGCVKV